MLRLGLDGSILEPNSAIAKDVKRLTATRIIMPATSFIKIDRAILTLLDE